MTRIATIFAAFALTVLTACGPQFERQLAPGDFIPRSTAYRTAVHADADTHNFPVVTYGGLEAHDVIISHNANNTRKEVEAAATNLTVYFDPNDPQLDAGLTFAPGTTFPDGRAAESVQVVGVSTDIFVESNSQVRDYVGGNFRLFSPRLSKQIWFNASEVAIDERDNGVVEARGGWDSAQARISWNGGEYETDPRAYGTFNYSPGKGYGQARVRAGSPRLLGDECATGDICSDWVDFYIRGEAQ